MPNFFAEPLYPALSKPRRWLPICLLFMAAGTSSAQILARPGYKGASAKADAWWKDAIFYNISVPSIDCKDLSTRLDALRTLNVDALILPAPALPASGSNGAMPNLDDFDDLLRQASAHGIRVLLTIHAPGDATDLSGLARFWLNRGVAGLHIATVAGEDPQSFAQYARKLASNVAGQRIIISDLDLAPSNEANSMPDRRSAHRASRPSTSLSSQLQIDERATQLPTLDAASLRPLLMQDITQPSLLLDLRPSGSTTEVRPPLAEALAAIALVTQPAALIDSSANLMLEPTIEQPRDDAEPPKPATPPPPPPPGTYLPYVPYLPPAKPLPAAAPRPVLEDPFTAWCRQLAALHHDNSVLRSGSTTFLDFDRQNALVWVTKPGSNAPRLTAPVVVICNLSAAPLQLSLADTVKRLDLHGFFLRTLLRTDNAMGAQDLNAVNVPAFGVYIGELHR